MNELVIPFLTYSLLMIFTPGPNNVSASALGLRLGYRASLPYLLGISSGFMLIMLGGGFLTEFLTRNYALVSPWLRWIGALYMGWLAVSLFVASPKKKEVVASIRDGYAAGLLLQFVNPKGIIFGITIYGSFSALLTGSLARTLGSTIFLTVMVFASVSVWTLIGSVLSRLFAQHTFRLVFNGVMALLLMYSAISIVLH
jgi:cysteine/O-acetylserine efflux protein